MLQSPGMSFLGLCPITLVIWHCLLARECGNCLAYAPFRACSLPDAKHRHTACQMAFGGHGLHPPGCTRNCTSRCTFHPTAPSKHMMAPNVFATYQCIHGSLHFALIHLVLFVFIHNMVISKWSQHFWVRAAVLDQPAAMAEWL